MHASFQAPKVPTVRSGAPFFGPLPKREYTIEGVEGAFQCLGPDGKDLEINDRFSNCAPMLNSELAKVRPLG